MKCCNPKLLDDSKASILLRLSELEEAVKQIRKDGICHLNTEIAEDPEYAEEKDSMPAIQSQNKDNSGNILSKSENLEEECEWQHIEEEIPFENSEDVNKAVESDDETNLPEEDFTSSDDEILSLFSDYL